MFSGLSILNYLALCLFYISVFETEHSHMLVQASTPKCLQHDFNNHVFIIQYVLCIIGDTSHDYLV